ncbi:65437eff-260c-4d10-8210-d307a5012d28 [Sclerotinia trifoliorum]|uniref:65437eff-260c-4d10-8210-d307a5012d28 n=1 Tax=Sclerotinia trifoliorum TaxID=28548 RepID=A0A8H2VYL3_9HELO|nr:65437eff-260c-4d10-8210-d307a5012d28 [Sclerotinia trifoliorum]
MSQCSSEMDLDGPDVDQEAMPLRLLSLDGGGIRGLSELLILDEIMRRLKHQCKSSDDLLPADYFDMMCGTSTGGLNALLLGRLRLPTTEAIKCYASIAEQIFKGKKSKALHGYTFDASNMEQAIKSLLENKYGLGHGDDRMLMNEEENCGACKTFVCAVSSLHVEGAPTKFRSWLAVKDQSYNCKIWEAARATCAAPRLFKSIMIGENGIDEEFVDAGLGCNNPVQQVIAEARSVFGPLRPVTCILSIGAGTHKPLGFTKPKSALERAVPSDLVNVLAGLATSTEKEAAEMDKKYRHIPGIYHRLNVGRDIGEIKLEEWEELGQVTAHTKAYLRKDDIDHQIDEIVAALAHERTPKLNINLQVLDGRIHHNPVTIHTHACFPVDLTDTKAFIKRSCMGGIEERINQVLLNGSTDAVVLHGIGGCGKTQLALHYCREMKRTGSFFAIMWIECGSEALMKESFHGIAKSIMHDHEDRMEQNRRSAAALAKMREWNHNHPWLIVFDNMNSLSPHNIKSYIPGGGYGFIIITGRHPDLSRLGHSVSIGNLDEDEAIELLFNHTEHINGRTDEDIRQAREICRLLSCLSLAVAQAGAYIKNRRLELNAFAELYEQRREEIMAYYPPTWTYRAPNPSNPKQKIPLTLFTIWEQSFKCISGEMLNAKRHFLCISAFLLNGTRMSSMLFQNCFNMATQRPRWMEIFRDKGTDSWSQSKFEGVLEELSNLSLCQIVKKTKHDECFYSFHPMIREWALYRPDPRTRQDLALEALCILQYSLRISKGVSIRNSNSGIEKDIEACFLNWVKFGSQPLSGNSEIPHFTLFMSLFFEESGKYSVAKELREKVEVYSQEHDRTLYHLSRRHLALALVRLHRFREAEKIIGGLLESLPKDLCDTEYELQLSLELSYIYVEMGRNTPNKVYSITDAFLNDRIPFNEHNTTRQRLIGTHTELFKHGKDHEAKVKKLWSARSLRVEGHYDASEAMEEEIYRDSLRKSGDTDFFALISQANLAGFMERRGDIEKALELQRTVFRKFEQKYGVSYLATHALAIDLYHMLMDHGYREEADTIFIKDHSCFDLVSTRINFHPSYFIQFSTRPPSFAYPL